MIDTPQPRPVFMISITLQAREAVDVQLQSRTRRRLGDLLRGEDLRATEVRIALQDGRPYEEIVNYAIAAGADLIVVGERSETRAQHLLRHLAFESVGERVRREAPCPVLTVR